MIQTIKQTWEERYDMYMRLSKEELASILAEQDRYLFPEGCTDV